MLVYAKNVLGILTIGQYKVYGRNWHRKPTDIPFELYQANLPDLLDGTYRVDGIAFTYRELKIIPTKSVDKIALAMKIRYDLDWNRKKKIEAIKAAIRNGVTTY
jgi:hypothetical protein